MKHYYVKLSGVFVSLFVTLVAFQNCSQKFETVEEGLSASDSVLSLPSIEFSGTPEAFTAESTTLSFAITGTVTSVTCSLNGGATSDCSSGSVTFNNLADGDYFLEVIATSAIGSVTRRHLFRKDGTAPVINVTVAPPSTTSLTTASFVFSVLDQLSGLQNVQCSIDNSQFSDCVSPVNLTNLSIANHNLRIQAQDRVGNRSLIYSYNWSVVAPAAPTVVISSAPVSLTNLSSVQISFNGMNTTSFECSLDAAAFATCTSPQSFQNLASGSHIFRVRGVSSSGVRSIEATANWILDLTVPSTPVITSNVQASTNQTAATMTFSSTDANGISRFECSLDSAAFATCTSPRSLTNLSAGSHRFRVRSIDQAGNTSSIGEFTWVVDQTNPNISLTQTPPASSSSTSASFSFTVTDSASGVAQIQCSLNSASFTNCTSPVNLTSVPVGSNQFRIQARDQAGNTTLVSHSWTVTAVVPPPAGNTQVVAGVLRWRSGFENGVPGEWLNYITNFFPNGNITGPQGWTLVNNTSGEPVYSGQYAYKGSVLSRNGASGGVRRAYPMINSDLPTPLINTFMIYLDVNYTVMGSGDWISIATFSNHPDRINWPDIHGLSIVNRRLEMAHMEQPGFSGQYVGPQPQAEFPTRRWVRITTYIHYESTGRGRVDVWQDGVRVYTGIQQSISTNTTMTVGHWGLYTNDANWQAHLYNDDIGIWSLSQPLTDFVREPVVQP